MKNLLLIVFVAFGISGDLMAQKSRSTESKSSDVEVVRADRKVAIAGSIGFKSLAGVGGLVTYYATPHIAIDAGAGLGLQVFKGGVRGRYLFTKKRFTPYVGLGLSHSPLAIEDVQVDNSNGSDYLIDLKASTYGQLSLGLEFLGYNGFLLGFDVGYSKLMNEDNFTNQGDPFDAETQLAFDIIYGSSLNFSFTMGYAF